MSTQSERFHSQKAKNWRATQKKGRLRYALIYGSLWGSAMILVNLLTIADESGMDSISWPIILGEWIWIPLGILSFYTFFWWANTKYYSHKEDKKTA